MSKIILQLEQVFQGIESASVRNCVTCANVEGTDERSECLKSLIRKYFQSTEDTTDEIVDAILEEVKTINE